MKKIAIITAGIIPVPPVKGGAVENLVYTFLKENENYKDYDVSVFSIDDKLINKADYLFNNAHFILIKDCPFLAFFDRIIYGFAKVFLKSKNTTIFRNLLNRYRFFKKNRKYLKENDYDLVILENHFAEFISLKTKYLQNKYNNKVMYHAHNIPAHYKHFMKYAGVLNSIYSVSEALSHKWEEVFKSYKMDNLKFGVIKNGVDSTAFYNESKQKNEPYMAKLAIPSDKKIILYAGRMVRQKGIFELIEAMKKLDDSYYLLLIGDFFYNAKTKNKESVLLEKEIEGIKDRVKFTGFIDYKEMPQVYSLADIVVLPSISFDSAPLTLLEAVCSIKPIITTNIGGIPEYAKEAGSIILDVDDNLVNNLASNISNVFNDSNLKEGLIKKSLEIYQGLDNHNFYLNYVKAIKETLE